MNWELHLNFVHCEDKGGHIKTLCRTSQQPVGGFYRWLQTPVLPYWISWCCFEIGTQERKMHRSQDPPGRVSQIQMPVSVHMDYLEDIYATWTFLFPLRGPRPPTSSLSSMHFWGSQSIKISKRIWNIKVNHSDAQKFFHSTPRTLFSPLTSPKGPNFRVLRLVWNSRPNLIGSDQ